MKNEKDHNHEMRQQVLDKAADLFQTKEKFKHFTIDERRIVAGIRGGISVDLPYDIGYFGAMSGNGNSHNRIKDNHPLISDALDLIPLTGPISKSNYDDYVQKFKETLPGDPLATATRLLAMKRPDTFLCVDSKNKRKLSQSINLPISKVV